MNPNKKIVFLISNNFIHDNRTLRQAQALVGEGYEVTIVCPLIKADLPRQEVIDGITVKRVLDDWLPTVPKYKVQWIECRKYLRAVLAEKADIYISKDLDTLFYGWRAAKKHKAKLVYNADEYWQDLTVSGLGPRTQIYYKVAFYLGERFLAKKADLVTTVNDALAGMLKKVLKLKKQPLVIMNSPESVVITRNDQLVTDSGFKGKKIVIYVGIFSEGRGLEKLISATKLLPNDIATVFLGYGALKDSLNKQIKKEKLTDRVKILDPVPTTRLLNYISSADIGVIPVLPISTSYRLCLPNKFFEYLLAGLPICSSDLPVLAGLVDQYGIGETYDPFSAVDLAKTIESMLYNKPKYSQYKKNLVRAGNDLNWAHEKKKFLKEISEL